MQGSGTSSNPYILSSTSDLALLSGDGYASYAGAGVYFQLGANIDFSSGTFSPIGNSTYPFNGHFDGKNYKIKNMSIDATDYRRGLFSVLSGSAEVKNIYFDNCTLSSYNKYYQGILSGTITSPTNVTISNIETNACVVQGGSYLGGIVGLGMTGTVGGAVTFDNCYVHDGSIINSSYYYYVGGICAVSNGGSSSSSSPTFKYTNCKVEREYINCKTEYDEEYSYAGGIVGKVGGWQNLTIKNCKTLSSLIIAKGNYVGGICGNFTSSYGTNTLQYCDVDNCVIQSTNYEGVGGIFGHFGGSLSATTSYHTVTNCTIVGVDEVGGIIGTTYSSGTQNVRDCDVKHNVIYATKSGGSHQCGGAIGRYGGSGTVYNGTQDYNNIVGTGGKDCATVTNQTSVSGQYITATSLSASVSSRTATYTISGQRGAAISYNSSTNLISGGRDWTWGDGSTSTNYTTNPTHTFSSYGTFTTSAHLYNPLDTTGVTLSCSVTIRQPPSGYITGNVSGRTWSGYTYSESNVSNRQWQYSTDYSTWNNLGTSTSQTYTFSGYKAYTYYMRCVFYNSAGDSATSNVVTMSVSGIEPTISISESVSGRTVTITQSSSYATSYQWQYSDDNSSWTDFSTTTSSSATYDVPTTYEGYKYFRVIATNDYTSTTSSVVSQYFYALPTISIVGSLTKRTYTLTPTYTYTTSMGWQESTDQSIWTQISTTLGAITRTFRNSESGTFYFRCIATGDGGSTTSNTVSTTIEKAAGISVHDQAWNDRCETVFTNHDQSFVGRW